MSIKEIVEVIITRQTTAISRAGFGTILILDPHVNWNERTRTYSAASQLLDDGFESTDSAYLAALSAFSQTPSPINLKVGRRQVDSVGVTIDTVIDNTDYVIDINGTPFTFNSGVTATNITIATGLVGQINLGVEPVTAVDGLDGTFVLNADVAGTAFSVAITGVNFSVDKPIVASDTVADDLTAIKNEDPNWYALVMTSHVIADVQAAAVWIEAEIKIFLTSSNDTEILNAASTTDIAYLLNAAAYDRSGVIYSATDSTFPEAAWLGKQLPTDPGSTTWMFKTLSGVTFDALTDTQSTNARNKKANTYENIAGVNMTQEGTVASGEYIDIIRGVDWLQARITENVFSRFVNLPKIPYTDGGIAIIESEVISAITEGIDSGFIAESPQFTVSVPLAADVSSVDKIARFLPDVEFVAYLAGAIHKTKIEGVVSL